MEAGRVEAEDEGWPGVAFLMAAAKTAAERKQDERERMRARGFVLRQVWVHPKDWERVKAYLARVNNAREK